MHANETTVGSREVRGVKADGRVDALERGPCSNNTGACCRARSKLSEKVIHRLTVNVSMPDPRENQEAYPQQPQHQEGAQLSDRPCGGTVVIGGRDGRRLIRQTLLQSAQASGHSPRWLSFTAAMQPVTASWLVIVWSNDSVAGRLIEAARSNLPGHIIGNRPGRVEPRAAKRRPKPHHLLTKPRDEARAELVTEKSP